MKEQLVALLVSKVGLDEEKANQAVDTVLGYVQENPAQITEYLSKFGAGGIAEKLGGLGGMFGK
jgi:nucleoid DNA-binding protein